MTTCLKHPGGEVEGRARWVKVVELLGWREDRVQRRASCCFHV